MCWGFFCEFSGFSVDRRRFSVTESARKGFRPPWWTVLSEPGPPRHNVQRRNRRTRGACVGAFSASSAGSALIVVGSLLLNRRGKVSGHPGGRYSVNRDDPDTTYSAETAERAEHVLGLFLRV